MRPELRAIKTVILAGGLGTRLGATTALKPKPMVEVGDRPILWHILDLYARQGFNHFLIALGYRGHVIRRFFLERGRSEGPYGVILPPEAEGGIAEGCRVDLVDTGPDTLTGGRLLRLKAHLEGAPFMMTYGDGLADVDLGALLAFHRGHGRTATLTAVHPPPRFGRLTLKGGTVRAFQEKPEGGGGWINGGFFVFEPGIFDHLQGDETILEGAPLSHLAKGGELMAHRHGGFWACMDTPQDVARLNSLWTAGDPPWRRTSLRREGPTHLDIPGENRT